MRHLVLACLVACGSPPRAPARPEPPAPAHVAQRSPAPRVNHLRDPDLAPPPPVKLLSIDWASAPLASEADALALWQRIAPTGDDYQEKLDEIPAGPAHALAIALLHEGHFACQPAPATGCATAAFDLPEPAPSATLADPCLRRLLALWAIDQLTDADIPVVHDALIAIATLSPPESQLPAAAIEAIPVDDQDGRLELLGVAWEAGQHELVNGMLAPLDETHLIAAATRLHIDGALDRLNAQDDRPAFLAAVTDDQLPAAARISAMGELADAAGDQLPADLRAALHGAGKSPDCTVVAGVARTLDHFGDHAFAPRLPRTHSPAVMMRSLCVLASFEQMQHADEPSYLPTYLPARGLELVTEAYDPLEDPPVTRTDTLVPQGEAVLPEIDDLVRAMQHCTGTTCQGTDHAFHFTFRPGAGGLLLAKLEVHDLPPCQPE